MSNVNSLIAFRGASLAEVIEALGITQFSGTSGENFTHIFQGLIIQGGTTTSIAGATYGAAMNFNVGFPKQVLFFVAFPIGTDPGAGGAEGTVISLNQFRIANKSAGAKTFYWFAIGV